MVGNLWEWVTDWVPLSPRSVPAGAGSVVTSVCLAGAFTSFGPGALIRGGSFTTLTSGTLAGVFAVTGHVRPESALDSVGFRAAR